MRLLHIKEPADLKKLMKEIGVDHHGIELMYPKAFSFVIKINSLPWTCANILKQEALSVGADLAVSRYVLVGKLKNADCLLMGSLKQLKILKDKLLKQPFNLKRIASDLERILENYHKEDYIWDLGKIKINLNKRVLIMGIVNLTPDSFSGDGLYKNSLSYNLDLDRILYFIEELIKNGADIIDIGGESTRPGAKPVSLEEEIKRTIPVIKKISKRINIPISIDTYKPEVAEQAIENGALIVNDITGLRNPKMLKLVKKYKTGVIVMHMKGNPRTMQRNPQYNCVVEEIIKFLDNSTKRAIDIGIAKDKIVIDPGIGFGKTLEHNLEILKHLEEFKILGFPILIGVSRKSFIGKILNIERPNERLFGTIASALYAVKNGAKILRVHDVLAIKQALSLWEACEKAN